MDEITKKVAIIVAHPDDEILWAGGTILSKPNWQCYIITLCRKDDPDRAPKFEQVLKILGVEGCMGDLDDSPEQLPLDEKELEKTILNLLPSHSFHLIITHSIYGEYTRHKRHEEIGRAVINLWHAGKLRTDELWAFAYEDHDKKYLPAVIEDAPVFFSLPHDVWLQKHYLITHAYGFNQDSWEAQTTPKEEAFWQFFNADPAYKWLVSADTKL